MAKQEGLHSSGITLGMEYFCSRGDDLLTFSDADLVALAKNEISQLGLAEKSELDPWEVNTERSYYEEQVLSPDKKHEGTEILTAEKAPPHEAI